MDCIGDIIGSVLGSVLKDVKCDSPIILACVGICVCISLPIVPVIIGILLLIFVDPFTTYAGSQVITAFISLGIGGLIIVIYVIIFIVILIIVFFKSMEDSINEKINDFVNNIKQCCFCGGDFCCDCRNECKKRYGNDCDCGVAKWDEWCQKCMCFNYPCCEDKHVCDRDFRDGCFSLFLIFFCLNKKDDQVDLLKVNWDIDENKRPKSKVFGKSDLKGKKGELAFNDKNKSNEVIVVKDVNVEERGNISPSAPELIKKEEKVKKIVEKLETELEKEEEKEKEKVDLALVPTDALLLKEIAILREQDELNKAPKSFKIKEEFLDVLKDEENLDSVERDFRKELNDSSITPNVERNVDDLLDNLEARVSDFQTK